MNQQYTNNNKGVRVFIKWILIFILATILLTPLLMWLLWKFSPEKPITIFVLDKTVLTQNYQEHASLFELMKNNKFVKPDSSFYNIATDYYGFFPDGKGYFKINDLANKDTNQLDSIASIYDMLYYTDLYGIYKAEWFATYPEIANASFFGEIGDRSQSLYGGMHKNDLYLLQQMKKSKKLIINEFNIIASPTGKELREEYETEFGVQWTGWVGRYFDNLDTLVNKELPRWLIDNYVKDNKEWPFKNSGIAFVRNDDKVVILENKTHLNIEVPIIHTNKTEAKKYCVAKKMKYPFWFDIVRTDTRNDIVSNYRISANEVGDSILTSWNIPKEFPAVLRSNQAYPYYYFAGDFADNPISMKTAKYKYLYLFSSLLNPSTVVERYSFYWKFYRPMTSKIMHDYYNQISN
jgi:hypothetical protein